MSRISSSVKRKIKERDEFACQICFRTARELGGRDQLTVDHIVPLSKGGSGRMENLQTACTDCNQEKADKMPDHGGDFKIGVEG